MAAVVGGSADQFVHPFDCTLKASQVDLLVDSFAYGLLGFMAAPPLREIDHCVHGNHRKDRL
jgi:hypothetical protein